MKDFLENFRLAKYRFVLRPTEFLKLSHYPGSSLRKNFIQVFQEISCTNGKMDCRGCPKRAGCPYYEVMEGGTRKDPKDDVLKRFQTPPKPFIFEPPLSRKTFYSSHEDLIFDLILVGKALEYFPYFVATMRQIGELGMGRNQGTYTLRKIYGIDLRTNYVVNEFSFENSDENVNRDISVSLADLYKKFLWRENTPLSRVELTLLTPLRMKRVGIENWHLFFRTLLRSVLTRISIMNFFHNGYPEIMEFPVLLEEARTIRIEEENLIWDDWRSPAYRYNSDTKLGGYIGDITYVGPLESYWPLLKIGEILHIGKNCGFGLGRIMVEQKH